MIGHGRGMVGGASSWEAGSKPSLGCERAAMGGGVAGGEGSLPGHVVAGGDCGGHQINACLSTQLFQLLGQNNDGYHRNEASKEVQSKQNTSENHHTPTESTAVFHSVEPVDNPQQRGRVDETSLTETSRALFI